ncbi:hypothetical protein MMC22_006795 [Lobaria immixta]|nr:hypothetical protein [Lobaria immixta]
MLHNSSTSEHVHDNPSPSPHPIDVPASRIDIEIPSLSLRPNDHPAGEHGKEETSSMSPVDNLSLQKSNTPPSERRQNLFMVFITLTQLVQMIPLGAGINSGLAIGEALGATRMHSVWIAASYPLTEGAFVLIGGRLGAVYGHKNIFSAGCVWWVLQQLGLHVLYERSVWDRRRPDDSEHCRFAGHHLPARKEMKPWYGSLWSNGTCRRSWR